MCSYEFMQIGHRGKRKRQIKIDLYIFVNIYIYIEREIMDRYID